MALKSDGISRETFLAAWRDAMWVETDVAERARLVMELARIDVREFGRADPMAVAVVEHEDAPIQIVDLTAVELTSEHALRRAIHARLGAIGPAEVYAVVTVSAGQRDGIPQYLLLVWGESLDGTEVCWLKPFRKRADHLEEAPELRVPDPHATRYSSMLAGILPRRH